MKKSSTTVIITACSTLLVLAIIWKYSQSTKMIIIKVETLVSQSSVLGMERVIQAQKRTIDLYTHRPKVIYRCLDDEPKIKFPKHASDGYTTVTMGTNDKCGKTKELDAVIIVHTAAKNFDKRERFRQIYSNRNVTWPYKLKVVFLIGKVVNAELQINLEIENRKYGDTVQGNFVDTYQNLTLKATMGYRWVSEMCDPDYRILVKMDDDVVLDVHRFFGDFYGAMPKDKMKKRIMCQVWKNAPVNRYGKWKVERGLFANSSYAFPYCSGFLVVVTPDLVKSMYETMKSIDFFWIDDVFVYGMVPRAMRFVGFTNIGGNRGGMITQEYTKYKKCMTEKKDACPYLGIVTSTPEEFFDAFNNFPHQKHKLIVATKDNLNIKEKETDIDEGENSYGIKLPDSKTKAKVKT